MELAVGTPDRTYSEELGGWAVHWDRLEKNIRVRGDGTLVRVWPDGRIASASRTSHALAAAPSKVIDAAVATEQVNASLSQIVAEARSDLKIQPPVLEWVRPNGAFQATRPIDGDPVCRLAWVVNVEGGPKGAFTLLTVFIDAGDGSLLGGDIVD